MKGGRICLVSLNVFYICSSDIKLVLSSCPDSCGFLLVVGTWCFSDAALHPVLYTDREVVHLMENFIGMKAQYVFLMSFIGLGFFFFNSY